MLQTNMSGKVKGNKLINSTVFWVTLFSLISKPINITDDLAMTPSLAHLP